MEINTACKSERKPLPFFIDFEAFYAAYHPIVLGYLRKKTSSFADAEDVAGKVFLYCYEKWDTYDPSKASQSTWIFLIVRSKWIDFLRKKRPHANIDELDQMLSNGENPIENAERLDAIRQELAVMLSALPENQRKAIVLRYFCNHSDDEIASHLFTTAGNIRVLIHRGLKKLQSGLSLEITL